MDFARIIAHELGVNERQVAATLTLLDEGGTVPFIARYRKERTGALDEVQIRQIEERRAYLKDLEDRRSTILEAIEAQGKLTGELKKAILAAETKAVLEDLYAPYKKKRNTRGQMALERGLGPLAEQILAQGRDGHPEDAAKPFVGTHDKLTSVDDVLQGARDIVAEDIADRAEIRGRLRDLFHRHGILVATKADKKDTTPTKFEQYYDYQERVANIPSHRFLAIRRGERDGVLRAKVELSDPPRAMGEMEDRVGVERRSPWGEQLQLAVADAYKRLLAPRMETDVRLELKTRSDDDAVGVFATNARAVLMAAPFGTRPVIGIDPGIRTGCKCAVVDGTGRFIENQTIYIGRNAGKDDEAKKTVLTLADRHRPHAIAVGNGTGGRETEAFVRKALKESHPDIIVVSVNESGASIYSASDVAREEFPELDLTIRGAISIARRLQDPLSELVKIDPKSIGVGQYQHDVHQPLLQRKLTEVVESCVNNVGVELNTASAPLLGYVAGIGSTIAGRIVTHRNSNGPFQRRKDLLKVSGLGPKTYEQAAGFLRIRESEHPLDRSAVHPERYELVERMAADIGVPLAKLVGQSEAVGRIDIRKYVSDDVGEPTLRDIVDELKKPGRDPRDAFEAPRFRSDVNEPSDLEVGMTLEGVVTNVTNFGAFVDIGVHQDGLVHISQLADRFVRDPNDVVKTGDKITVRVLSVDLQRKRIALTAKSGPIEELLDGGRKRGGSSGSDRGGRPDDRRKSGGRDGGRGNQGRGGRRDDRRGDGRGDNRRSKTTDDGNLSHNPFAALKKGK